MRTTSEKKIRAIAKRIGSTGAGVALFVNSEPEIGRAHV
jgi:hypothetical protein